MQLQNESSALPVANWSAATAKAGVTSMNWGAFDLNLLIVFDAVMQERSVT
jgi:hypothetical protein